MMPQTYTHTGTNTMCRLNAISSSKAKLLDCRKVLFNSIETFMAWDFGAPLFGSEFVKTVKIQKIQLYRNILCLVILELHILGLIYKKCSKNLSPLKTNILQYTSKHILKEQSTQHKNIHTKSNHNKIKKH